jgi:uncharacterized YccA/Bax inhibitor family protein
MATKNPVLSRMEAEAKRNGGYAGFGAPTATGTLPGAAETATVAGVPGAPVPPAGTVPAGWGQPDLAAPGRTMALPDVIAKTFIMFAVMLPVALVTWIVEPPTGVFLVAIFAALGVGIWASVKRVPSPPLFLLYAAIEGVVLGGISQVYNQWAIANGAEQGIVGTAIAGTLIVFVLMLALYRSRIIKINGRIAKVFTVALVGYLILGAASLVLGLFGVGGGWGLFGLGWIGIAISFLAVALASFSLVMDFAAIEQMINAGAPERESWRAAFGLVVSLVWLYLELLRLLALLQSGGNR